MSLLNSFKELLETEKEPLEIEELTSADELFRDKRKEQFEEIKEESTEFREKAEAIIDDLNRKVQNLSEFEDNRDRSVIDDVLSNIVDDKKEVIENFSASENPEELYSDIDEFLQQFKSMSRKEAAVMDEINKKDQFAENLGKLEDLKEELNQFIETKYVSKQRYENIKQDIRQIEELNSEIRSLESQIKNLNVKPVKEEVASKKEKLNSLENGSLRQDYDNLKDQLEEVKEKDSSQQKKIGRAMGKMERGLKKLLYEGKIGKLSREGSETLKQIRDGKREKIIDQDSEVILEAVESVEESVTGDFLDNKTREKLLDGSETLKDIPKIKEEIQNARAEEKRIQDNLDSHDYLNKREKLENTIEKLQKKLSDTRDKKEDLLERKKDISSQIEGKKQSIIDLLEEEFDREVSLR